MVKNEPTESTVAYGDFILAIITGKENITELSRYLKKAPATIHDQMTILLKEGWVKRDGKKIVLNEKRLIDYFSKEFKIKKKTLDDLMMLWLEQIVSFQSKQGKKPMSIDQLGFTLQVNATLFENVKDGMTAKELMNVLDEKIFNVKESSLKLAQEKKLFRKKAD